MMGGSGDASDALHRDSSKFGSRLRSTSKVPKSPERFSSVSSVKFDNATPPPTNQDSALSRLSRRQSSRLGGMRRIASVVSEREVEDKQDEIDALQKRLDRMTSQYRTTKQQLEGDLEVRDQELSKTAAELEYIKASVTTEKLNALSELDDEYQMKNKEMQKKRREADLKVKIMTDKHKAALLNAAVQKMITYCNMLRRTSYHRFTQVYSLSLLSITLSGITSNNTPSTKQNYQKKRRFFS